MERMAVYPGSFDPITKGHLDIIERAARMFDTLVVAILVNQGKNSLFSLQERKEFIEKSVKDLTNVQVDTFSGLFVDYCIKKDIKVAIRGLRTVSDFEIELQMAHINDFLSKGEVETLFLASNTQYSYVSSSTVKEIAMFGGDASKFLPPLVDRALKEKISKQGEKARERRKP